MLASPLKSLYISLFNLKEQLHHHISASEIALIKNTTLFNTLDDEQFKELLTSIKLIRYPEGSLIIREGELGDALYIIAEGSVLVFTYHIPEVKTLLARLNKGDYFGEQALLSETNKSRSANIEAITETTLIKIDEKTFTRLLQKDNLLKIKLTKLGCEQALNVLSLPNEFYNEMGAIISQIEIPRIIDLPNNHIIFNVNDKSDNVYLILKGEVEIILPKKIKSESKQLLLHKGHIFGELGVLLNQTRSATAVAHTPVRLLAIEGKYFKEQLALKPRLQQILSTLQKTYQLPTEGAVDQYIGNVLNMGTAITNVIKLDNGQSIISSQFVDQHIFMMSIVGTPVQASYQYKNEQKQIELGIYNNRLSRIKAYGSWEDLPIICHALLKNRIIDEDKLINFEITGELKLQKRTEKSRQIICPCMSISKKQVQGCIDNGIKTLDGLADATGVCTICRNCQPNILEMLGEASWLSAVMQKSVSHNANVNSYSVKPTFGEFTPFLPGQHIIIQTQIDENWIERPYTISGIDNNGNLRITIKKMTNGFFTQWIFGKESDQVDIKITQPQGLFTLNMDENTEALCFAGGIGITPFITFAKALAAKRSNKRLHIFYRELSKDRFIFVEEFNEVINLVPSFTISYRSTDIGGMLFEDEVIKLVRSFNKPDIYICGSENFTNFFRRILNNTRYDKKKIHIEEFVHAGYKK